MSAILPSREKLFPAGATLCFAMRCVLLGSTLALALVALQGCGDEVTYPECGSYSKNSVGPLTDATTCRTACVTAEGLAEKNGQLEDWKGSSGSGKCECYDGSGYRKLCEDSGYSTWWSWTGLKELIRWHRCDRRSRIQNCPGMLGTALHRRFIRMTCCFNLFQVFLRGKIHEDWNLSKDCYKKHKKARCCCHRGCIFSWRFFHCMPLQIHTHFWCIIEDVAKMFVHECPSSTL